MKPTKSVINNFLYIDSRLKKQNNVLNLKLFQKLINFASKK